MNKTMIVIAGMVLCLVLLISACGHKGDPQPPDATIPMLNIIK